MAFLKIPQQLWFAFTGGTKRSCVVAKAPAAVKVTPVGAVKKSRENSGRDAELEMQARTILTSLGLDDGARSVRVEWNPRLRSTAGYAKWPQWVVELNPRLKEFAGETERTMKHELAHLVAYTRAGRRRIEPHGTEWRRACVDLGIPDERASHTMPLPRHKQRRKFSYVCPGCGTTTERVRKFKRFTACLACCKKHNGGRYDARFQFVIKQAQPTQAATPSSRA